MDFQRSDIADQRFDADSYSTTKAKHEMHRIFHPLTAYQRRWATAATTGSRARLESLTFLTSAQDFGSRAIVLSPDGFDKNLFVTSKKYRMEGGYLFDNVP